MKRIPAATVRLLFLIYTMALLAGCAGDSGSNSTAALESRGVIHDFLLFATSL